MLHINSKVINIVIMNRLKDIIDKKHGSINAFTKTLTSIRPRAFYNKVKIGGWTEDEICEICTKLDMRFEEIEDFMSKEYKVMLFKKIVNTRP